ncbi:hypothetical protein XENTR_v10009036 [Xenopus tropicalis]|nr:hypothetical protein XENTR_v10009036 [Xenopus tropicalis]
MPMYSTCILAIGNCLAALNINAIYFCVFWFILDQSADSFQSTTSEKIKEKDLTGCYGPLILCYLSSILVNHPHFHFTYSLQKKVYIGRTIHNKTSKRLDFRLPPDFKPFIFKAKFPSAM